MRIRSLSELLSADERSLRFAPGGLLTSGVLRPEDAAEFQQRVIAGADLVAAVPSSVRAAFERLRQCHSLGVVWYDAYTVAADLSHIVLELALRERFVEFYTGVIPLERSAGAQHVSVSGFDEYSRVVRRSSGKDMRLRTRVGGALIKPPLTLHGLLAWARTEGLLGGQRNRSTEALLPRLRNYVAHGTHRVTTPVESAQEICELAEVINRLWGFRTHGGRLHPAPRQREAFVVGWKGRVEVEELSRYPAAQFSLGMGPDVGDWTCIIVLAVPEDESLMWFESGCERTDFPCDLLWGPGSGQDAVAWWLAADVSGDEVECQDRVFAVRVADGRVGSVQRVEAIGSLPVSERAGVWHVVRADFPRDASLHASHQVGGRPAGGCGCPVSDLVSGSWHEVTARFGISAGTAGGGSAVRVRVPQLRETVGAALIDDRPPS